METKKTIRSFTRHAIRVPQFRGSTIALVLLQRTIVPLQLFLNVYHCHVGAVIVSLI